MVKQKNKKNNSEKIGNKKSRRSRDIFCGEYRARTDDLLHAMQAL